MSGLKPRLEDLFRGLVFYGTGGGGRADAGLALLRSHFGENWSPRFADPAELDPKTYCCATIVVGGRDPEEDVSPGERHALGFPVDDLPIAERFVRSVQALKRATGRDIGALAVVELGSLAMAATLVAADILGKPVLDCDGAGRSIPELGLAKFDLAGLNPAPAALVDRFGDAVVLLDVPSAAMADRIGRHLSRAAWGRGLACAGYLAPLSDFRNGLVAGSVAKAAQVGAILGREATRAQRLDALFAEAGGRVLFEGSAIATHWQSNEPYRFREFEYEITGIGTDTGHALRIWVKNEHHLVWRDDALIASSPDPIAVLDASTLEPLTTLGDVSPGREVIVVAVRALDKAWSSERGVALLGPRRFGFDLDPVMIGPES